MGYSQRLVALALIIFITGCASTTPPKSSPKPRKIGEPTEMRAGVTHGKHW